MIELLSLAVVVVIVVSAACVVPETDPTVIDDT
jgi:hypothetical protein